MKKVIIRAKTNQNVLCNIPNYWICGQYTCGIKMNFGSNDFTLQIQILQLTRNLLTCNDDESPYIKQDNK